MRIPGIASGRLITTLRAENVGQAVAFRITAETSGKDGPTRVLRKGVTVLLVDDESSQRTMMRDILENAGYIVLEAQDSAEALVIHGNRTGRIDIVLTDIALPGKDGCQLVKNLIEADPYLSAVFVSGLTGAELCRFYGLATTDIHFLAKPFAAAELLSRIRNVLKTGGPYLTRKAG